MIEHFKSYYKKVNKPKPTFRERKFHPKLYKNPENLYLIEAQKIREKLRIYRLYDKKTGLFKEPKHKKTKIEESKNFNTYENYNNNNNNEEEENEFNNENIISEEELNNNYKNYNLNDDKDEEINEKTEIKTNNKNKEIKSNNSYNKKNKYLKQNIKIIIKDKNIKKPISQDKNTESEKDVRTSLEEIESIIKKYKKKQGITISKRKKPLSRKLKKKQLIESLNDKNNPYSTFWPNYLLKVNYNSSLQVKGFQNGVPQLTIKKLNDEFFLPPINNNASQSKYSKFGFKTLSTFSNNYKQNYSYSNQKSRTQYNQKFYDNEKNNNDNYNNNNEENYNDNYNNNLKNNNNINYNIQEEKKENDNKEENNEDNGNNNAKIIFNNYDGSYDVRNDDDYEIIKKQIEEKNQNQNPKKLETKLDDINENENEES